MDGWMDLFCQITSEVILKQSSLEANKYTVKFTHSVTFDQLQKCVKIIPFAQIVWVRGAQVKLSHAAL